MAAVQKLAFYHGISFPRLLLPRSYVCVLETFFYAPDIHNVSSFREEINKTPQESRN